ncbi:hypothetical protein ACMFMF_007088 [Clarireedia jacksonii]
MHLSIASSRIFSRFFYPEPPQNQSHLTPPPHQSSLKSPTPNSRRPTDTASAATSSAPTQISLLQSLSCKPKTAVPAANPTTACKARLPEFGPGLGAVLVVGGVRVAMRGGSDWGMVWGTVKEGDGVVDVDGVEGVVTFVGMARTRGVVREAVLVLVRRRI